MRDLEQLKTHPRRSAPMDRYATIVDTARRRQRRALGAGAGVAAALAVVVSATLVVGAEGTRDSLRIDTPARQGVATAPPRAAGQPPVATGEHGTAPLAGQPLGPTAGRAAGPEPRAQSQQQQDSGRQSRSRPVERRDRTGVTVCGGIVSEPDRTKPRYCGRVEASLTRDGLLNLQLWGVLDAASAQDTTWTFDTAQEIDLTLSRNGHVVWRWSKRQAFAQTRHTLPMHRGGGYEWTTSWQPTDTSGRPLPKGEYNVAGTIRARELGTGNSWTTTVTL